MRFHGNGAPRLGRAFGFPVAFETPGDKGGGSSEEDKDKQKDPPAPPKKKDGEDDDEPVITQKQMNAIVKKRAEDLLKKELGVDDLGTLKQLLKDSEASKEAAKTQAERDRDKAVADAIAAKEKEWQERLDAQQAEADRRMIESEVRSVARSLNFHDPDDAWLRLADSVGEEDSPITIGDDGKIAGVKEALEKLAKDKPYLVKGEAPKGGGVPIPGGGGNGSLTDQQRMQRGATEIVFGRGRRR